MGFLIEEDFNKLCNIRRRFSVITICQEVKLRCLLRVTQCWSLNGYKDRMTSCIYFCDEEHEGKAVYIVKWAERVNSNTNEGKSSGCRNYKNFEEGLAVDILHKLPEGLKRKIQI